MPESSIALPTDIPYSASFPLPFRALLLLGLGIFGWASNLHGLHLAGVDAPSVLDLRPPSSSHSPLSLDFVHPEAAYKPVYALGVAYSIWIGGAWCTFRWLSGGEVQTADVFKYVPALGALGALLVLVCPWDVCRKRERDLFLLALKRCIFARADRPVYFSDIILADILTSFAKVFGDVWISACMLMPSGSLHILPALEGWSRWILPTLMSLPYAIRFQQCVVELSSPSCQTRRPLYNAIKYASAFPVIFLSAAQRIVASDLVAHEVAPSDKAWYAEHQLFRLWLLSAVVNSLYSFWWDVTNDWGLELLKPRSGLQKRQSIPRPLVLPELQHRKSSSLAPHDSLSVHNMNRIASTPRPYPWGLRRTLLYPLPVYPLLVFFNLVLRLTWSAKLSSHLQTGTGGPTRFLLEAAEVLRRWMWVFVRVEWEAVRRAEGGSAGGIATPLPRMEEEHELVFDARETVE